MLMAKAKKKSPVRVLVNIKRGNIGVLLHLLEWWTDKYEFIEEVGERVDHENMVTIYLTSPKFPPEWEGKVMDIIQTGDRITELVPMKEQP